jgi:eukaryotic-like serine/threonine-protein kinase
MIQTEEKLSHYKLLKKLGAGGMGEVYLAEDFKLGRKVALKVLPPDVARDRKRLTRFLQEARLAANLNHPNICVIYEVSGGGGGAETAEKPFIAMEFLEGETLAEKIRAGELSLAEILEIAVQIADALDEAHTRGVIHRDIKSANIIINRRGHAKVLDFGLAKTTGAAADDEISGEAETQAKTEAGMLVGTVPYMSPEHALGKRLDGRTDLWSFGVLLYEMATGGALPFRGATQAAVFNSILHENPPPPSEINENVSPELEGIIFKLLEKDRDFRYQTASDLRADLRRLQRQTGEFSSASLDSSFGGGGKTVSGRTKSFPAPAFSASGGRTGGGGGKSGGNLKLADTVGFEAAGTTAQTSPAFDRDRKQIWPKMLLASLLVLVVSLGAFVAYSLFYKKASRTTAAFQETGTRRLTSLGRVRDAVISPDGNYIAYVHDEGELQSVWLKQIVTGSLVQVVQPAPVTYQGMAFSPDGNWIYYDVWNRKSVGEIYRVPALGGNPQKIVHDCMPFIAVSPDGRQIAFIRSVDAEASSHLVIADVETRDERILMKKGRDEDANVFFATFAWSPDGKSLAVLGGKTSPEQRNSLWLGEISLADGSEKTIWNAPASFNGFGSGIAWKPDGSGIFLTLAENQSLYNQIWLVDYQTGEARRLTRDFNSYGTLSVTADGRKMVSQVQDFFASVWVVPADKPNEARKITGGTIEGIGVAWMPDGRIVYSSTVSGNPDIWIADADGANRKQLTFGEEIETRPCVASDGKKIYYLANNRQNTVNLWQINPDGSDRRQILVGGYQSDADCPKRSPAVFFFGATGKKSGFLRFMPDSGEPPVLVKDEIFFRTGVSNDGKRLAYSVWNPEKKQTDRVIYDIESGKSENFELPPTALGEQGQNEVSMRWTPDDKNLTFINQEKGVSNLWLYGVGSGKLTKLTNFNDGSIFTYDWSFDGRRLAVTRFSTTSDVVLISDGE